MSLLRYYSLPMHIKIMYSLVIGNICVLSPEAGQISVWRNDSLTRMPSPTEYHITPRRRAEFSEPKVLFKLQFPSKEGSCTLADGEVSSKYLWGHCLMLDWSFTAPSTPQLLCWQNHNDTYWPFRRFSRSVAENITGQNHNAKKCKRVDFLCLSLILIPL